MKTLKNKLNELERTDLVGAVIFAAVIMPLIIVLIANLFKLAEFLN